MSVLVCAFELRNIFDNHSLSAESLTFLSLSLHDMGTVEVDRLCPKINVINYFIFIISGFL